MSLAGVIICAMSVGVFKLAALGAKEEFEEDEWKKLLSDIGVEGEWEGIGHCAVGYIDGDIPQAVPRKADRVFWVE